MRTSLDRGQPYLIEESIARLVAFLQSHPKRYLGLSWNDAGFAVKRTVFAAPAATDQDLIDMYRTAHAEEWGFATIIPFGTNGHVADAWLNEGR